MNNPAVYSNDLFLFRDEEGKDHIYVNDPLSTSGDTQEILNLPEVLYRFMGHIPDRRNPMLMRVRLFSMKRTLPFYASIVSEINSGTRKHLEDYDNNIIDMTKYRSNDPLYPLVGVVIKRDGVVLGTRNYSLTGKCADGEKTHSLLIVSGLIPFKIAPAYEEGQENAAHDGSSPDDEDYSAF